MDYDFSFEQSLTSWNMKVGNTITIRYEPTPGQVTVMEAVVVKVENGRVYARNLPQLVPSQEA